MTTAAIILSRLREARGEWVGLPVLAAAAETFAVSERVSELRTGKHDGTQYVIENETRNVEGCRRKVSFYRLKEFDDAATKGGGGLVHLGTVSKQQPSAAAASTVPVRSDTPPCRHPLTGSGDEQYRSSFDRPPRNMRGNDSGCGARQPREILSSPTTFTGDLFATAPLAVGPD